MTFVVLKLLPAICADFKWQFSHEVWIKCTYFWMWVDVKKKYRMRTVERDREKVFWFKLTSIPIAKLLWQLYWQKRRKQLICSFLWGRAATVPNSVFKRIMQFDFNVRHLFHIIKPSLTKAKHNKKNREEYLSFADTKRACKSFRTVNQSYMYYVAISQQLIISRM